jgi:hypothetical protein
MAIEEAFNQAEIERCGTNVDEDDEAVVRAMYLSLAESEELSEQDIAVLMFVAGRTDQYDRTVVNVPMSPLLIEHFLRFLSEAVT